MSSSPNYKLYDVVLAGCTGYPAWPSKIIKCYSHSYVVVFYGQKTEAHVHETVIQPFSPASVSHLLSKKSNCKNSSLRRAIKLAEQVQLNRQQIGRVQEFEEEDFCVQLKNHKILKKQMQGDTHNKKKKDRDNPYEILKGLLDDFSLHVSRVHGGKISSQTDFDERDEQSLIQLLEKELSLEGVIKHRVLETMIVVLKELEQWRVPQYDKLKNRVASRFEKWKEQVLSEEGVETESTQRRNLVKKLKANRAVLGDRS